MDPEMKTPAIKSYPQPGIAHVFELAKNPPVSPMTSWPDPHVILNAVKDPPTCERERAADWGDSSGLKALRMTFGCDP